MKFDYNRLTTSEADFPFKLLSMGIFYFFVFIIEIYFQQENSKTQFKYNKTTEYPEISMWGIQNMSKVVYSCVIGNKDIELYPFNKQPGFDYILFSDVKYENTNWTVVLISEEIRNSPLIKEKKENFFKINPHLFFKNYDISIYIDLTTFRIVGNLDDFVFYAINPIDNIYILHHQNRQNVDSEFKLAFKNPKHDSINLLKRINAKYKKEKFPDNLGFVESTLIMRNHNSPDCIALMNRWWQEVYKYSYRDTLSFNYAMWKTKIKIKYMATYFAYDYFNRTIINKDSSKDKKHTDL